MKVILARSLGIHGNSPIQQFATVEEALSFLNNLSKIVIAEEDKDHPGFYDAYCHNGEIYEVSPVKEAA